MANQNKFYFFIRMGVNGNAGTGTFALGWRIRRVCPMRFHSSYDLKGSFQVCLPKCRFCIDNLSYFRPCTTS